MSKILLKFYSCVFIILSLVVEVQGQGACTQTLNQAQDQFEEGHLYEIPAMLKECLDKGFSNQEKIQAYWLLTRTYLIIDDPISAENSYIELLKLDPEYQIDEENDPIEIVYLSKKFKTTPIFEFTILKAGINSSKPSIIHQYGAYSANSNSESYASGYRFQMGPAVDYNINDNFSLSLEILFALKSYKSDITYFTRDVLKYTENQIWIDFPLYVRYERQYGKWSPYVYVGYSANLLLSATATSSFENDEISGSRTSDINNLKIKDQRNFFNTSWLAGFGTRYRIGYRYLSLEARFNGGLSNLLNKTNQFPAVSDPQISGNVYNSDLIFQNPRVDSDFRLNSVSVMLGYVWPIYKPRIITDKQNFLQKLFIKKKGNEQK